MKTKFTKLTLVLFIAVFANEVKAQFNLSGEFRPRSEYRKGYKTLSATDANAAFFTSQRTRLTAVYTSENFKTGLSLQDIRTWGDVAQLNLTDNHLSVHEAWGQYFFSKEFSIKLGRQEVIYDDHRIFGSVNWAQQARSHDLAVLKVQDGSFKMDLGLAFNQEAEKLFGTDYALNNYKTFQYIWAHQDFENIGMSFLLLNNGIQFNGGIEPDVVYSQTIGSRITYKKELFNVNAAAYYQGGKTGVNVDLSANYFSLEAVYATKDGFNFNAGFEHLSGNDFSDIGNSSEDKAFTPLYGTNHKFNGHMDYFYVGSHVGSVGLNDLFLGVKYSKDKFSTGLTAHVFSSAGEMDIQNSDLTKHLGTELDLAFGYNFDGGVVLNIGYSTMFASESMEYLKAGDSDEGNSWAYIMFVFKPNFLK
jgi:hypothetical protein